MTGKATLPSTPRSREQPQEEQERLLDRDLAALLVDEIEALARLVEDGAEVGADRRHEPLRLADRLRQRLALAQLLGEEAVRRDRLDPERAEHEREHERGRRVAVVDDDPEWRARIASASSDSSRSCA